MYIYIWYVILACLKDWICTGSLFASALHIYDLCSVYIRSLVPTQQPSHRVISLPDIIFDYARVLHILLKSYSRNPLEIQCFFSLFGVSSQSCECTLAINGMWYSRLDFVLIWPFHRMLFVSFAREFDIWHRYAFLLPEVPWYNSSLTTCHAIFVICFIWKCYII